MNSESLIDIYLDGLSSIGNDAGWEGNSVLSRLGEGRCDGPSDKSNGAMIQALDLYREKHPEFKEIERIVWKLMRNPRTALYAMAILTDRHYRGINQQTDKSFNDEDKTSLWAKHCAEMGSHKVLDLTKQEAIALFRYGARRASPRLIKQHYQGVKTR